MLTAMPAPSPDPYPEPYSLWSLGGGVAWLSSVALLAGTSSPHLLSWTGFLAVVAAAFAFMGALAFLPLLLFDLVKRPKLSPPNVPETTAPAALVVADAGAPMRRPTGWLPRYVLPTASRRTALTDLGLLALWRGLAYVPGWPPDHPACLAVLAAAVVLPAAYVALELRSQASRPTG